MYSSVLYRVIVGWLALGSLLSLSSCSVYDSLFHPHRLGTPAMTPEAKAKLRAAEKARHKGLTLTNPDADAAASADGTAPSADATPNAADKSKSYSELPAGTRATYDKAGLLKKSPLVRLQQNRNQLHHYDLSTPKHTAATRDERRMRKHSKSPSKKGAEPKAPAEATEPAPAPDPTQPVAAPAAKAANASKNPAARPAPTALAPRPAKVAPKPRTPRVAPLQASPPTTAPANEPLPTSAAEPARAKKVKKDQKAPKAPAPDPTQPPGSGN